jgi:hypothetical protein
LRSPASRAYPPASANGRPIDGSVFAGVANAFRSPYLVNVSLFVLLFVVSSTFLYFQQAEIVKTSFADRGAQTAFFATIDLAVNILTLGVQLFLSERIVVWLGVAVTLALLLPQSPSTSRRYRTMPRRLPRAPSGDGVPSRRATLQRPRYL